MSIYNGELWLEPCIISVINQTYSNFEFIIIDDGSTDKSLEIIKKYSKLDSRIKYITKINSGASNSLNFGLKLCNGKYIARIDQDDIWLEYKLSVQYSHLEKNNSIVLIGSGFIEIDSECNFIKVKKYSSDNNKLLKNLRSLRGFFPHSAAVYKREECLAVGGYNELLDKADDWNLWLSLSKHGSIYCVSSPLVYIRRHTNQRSKINSGELSVIHALIGSMIFHLRNNGYSSSIPNGIDGSNKMINWIIINKNKNILINEVLVRAKLNDLFFLRPNKSLIFFVSELFNILSVRFVFNCIYLKLFREKYVIELSNKWVDSLNENNY